MLFIDEAYALNSDDKFGPEAINTIVQEMENHRDDVIVIFAGYPEPMEEFLRSNEGLRSRIAFHLNFPDYNAEEMTDIFSIMLKEQGYTCSLLEQSIMKQSARLMRLNADTSTSSRTLRRKELITLLAEDIAIENMINYKQEKKPIGF